MGALSNANAKSWHINKHKSKLCQLNEVHNGLWKVQLYIELLLYE